MRLGLVLAAAALAADAAVVAATHALSAGFIVVGLLVLAWALSLGAFFSLIASGGGGDEGGGGPDGPPDPGEPPWWPEFERELRAYIDRQRHRPPRAPALTR
jgi:hypothetical protein